MQHFRFLTATLGEFHRQLVMSAFALAVAGLTDVMQQSGALGNLHIGAQLFRHHASEVTDLDGMFERVLPKTRAVAQAPQRAYQFRMQAGQSGAHHRAFAGQLHLAFHFGLGALDAFFDARGVDAAVFDETLQRLPGDFTAHRVEAGDDYRFRRVVNDQVHAGERFEGADIAAFTPDYAALQFIAGDGHHGDRAFHRLFDGDALHGHGDNATRFRFSMLERFVFDGAGHAGDIQLHLVAHLFENLGFRLLEGQPGNALQFFLAFADERVGIL